MGSEMKGRTSTTPPPPPVQRTACPTSTWCSDRISLVPKFICYRVSEYMIQARQLGK